VAAAHLQVRDTASQKIAALTVQVAEKVQAVPQRMTPAETEEGLVDLVARLAEIRARSHPQIFEALWQAQIMRVEELEEGEGEAPGMPTTELPKTPDAQTAGAATAEDPAKITLAPHTTLEEDHSQSATAFSQLSAAKEQQRTTTSSSNEPFNTSGLPIAKTFASTSAIPPLLPATMSVYISASHLPPAYLSPLPAAAPLLTNAYHWPSAPVQNHNFVPFFNGVNYRVDVPSASILG
jgi:hypothetical protein